MKLPWNRWRERRVLFVSPFPAWPLYGGAVVRNHHLREELARHNAVWAACRGPARPPRSHVQDWCCSGSEARLELINPLWWGRLAQLVRQKRIEAILGSSLLVGPQAAWLARACGVPFLYDAHNAESARLQRENSGWWRWVRLAERWTVQSASQVSCVSRADADALRSQGAGHVVLVPNGCTRALPSALPTRPRLLFYGVLSYGPNREAVEVLRREIMPRLQPEIQVVVAGVGGDPAWNSERLRWVGFVPDLPKLLSESSLTVVPLLRGGGTRLKILESVAAGRAVVSTPCGAEGLDREVFGEYLRVAENWDEFVRQVEELLRRPPASPPPADFWRRYAWDSLVQP